jgi:hypothetical protein
MNIWAVGRRRAPRPDVSAEALVQESSTPNCQLPTPNELPIANSQARSWELGVGSSLAVGSWELGPNGIRAARDRRVLKKTFHGGRHLPARSVGRIAGHRDASAVLSGARRRWLSGSWRHCADHRRMDRTVIIGSSDRHQERRAGCAGCDVPRRERAIIQDDAVHNAIVVREDYIPASNGGGVRRERLRAGVAGDGDCRGGGRRRRRRRSVRVPTSSTTRSSDEDKTCGRHCERSALHVGTFRCVKQLFAPEQVGYQ